MSSANVTPIVICKDHSANHRLHLIGYSLIFTAGLLLNVAAIWIFLNYLKLKSVVSIYMLNLAASDLLFTISLPFRISYYSMEQWPFKEFLCQVSGSVFQINMYGSCLFLMCINLDRYVAIVHPLRWRHLRRPRLARIVCLVVWVLILVGSIPVAYVHKSTSCVKDRTTITLCFENFSEGLWQKELLPLIILAEILGFLLPLTSVSYCSVRIFQKLCQAGGMQSLRQRKTLRMLVVNLVIFIICFVPYNVVLAVYGLIKAQLIKTDVQMKDSVRQALVITVILASMNCTLDPLIYYFNTEGFRNTFNKLRRAQAWDSEMGTLQNRVTESKSYQATSAKRGFPVQTLILPYEGLPFVPPKIFLNSPIEDSEI
uniref:Lysophosphatidic acid receptor 5 n=1 Tax=Podarcis muralis TaxID=64176 RepID=A0A670JTX0_PODMU|nr:lysophosphatidic acid receptor 5 [Podarcis muralis]XP_028568922.1 lysophosphatidic acid receptor 5 [Podarcis muralis]XP_028568923.1 lysophosphatidic acid receptor 5 [Podarcis muralis]